MTSQAAKKMYVPANFVNKSLRVGKAGSGDVPQPMWLSMMGVTRAMMKLLRVV